MDTRNGGGTASVLRCDGLVRRFGERTAVDGVGFEIAAGETYGLLGPNGAGKTTTISMIAGILEPDAGMVEIEGRRVQTRDPEAKRALGFVPQEIALFDDLTAAENLRFFGGLQGLSGRELASRVAATLDLVGLADRAGDRIGEFSGGMQRRANIAVGLLHRPRLLVLDEPTAGVDPQSRNQILESIERLGDEGLAVLYTTHYMEEAERLCDRVGIIDRGRLVDLGTPAELVRRHCPTATVVVVTAAPGAAAAFATIPGVTSVAQDADTHTIRGAAGSLVTEVIRCLAAHRIDVRDVRTELPTLEDVFLETTGRAMRD